MFPSCFEQNAKKGPVYGLLRPVAFSEISVVSVGTSDVDVQKLLTLVRHKKLSRTNKQKQTP
jgi:hypothetical protein